MTSITLSLSSQWPSIGRPASETLFWRDIYHTRDVSWPGGGGARHVRQGKHSHFTCQSFCQRLSAASTSPHSMHPRCWKRLSGCLRLTDGWLWSYLLCRRCRTLSSCTPQTLWTVTSPRWISLYPCPFPETASLAVIHPPASTALWAWTWVCHTLTHTAVLIKTSHRLLEACAIITDGGLIKLLILNDSQSELG